MPLFGGRAERGLACEKESGLLFQSSSLSTAFMIPTRNLPTHASSSASSQNGSKSKCRVSCHGESPGTSFPDFISEERIVYNLTNLSTQNKLSHHPTIHFILSSSSSASSLLCNNSLSSFPHHILLFNMHFLPALLASGLGLFLSGAAAKPLQAQELSKRCTYSASDRSCWGDYDLSTDYYTTVPDTGVTREVCISMTSSRHPS